MLQALLIAFVAALATGAATTYYLRRVHRRRLERAVGMRIVAGMRWREFSQLVVEALRNRGYEPDDPAQAAERGPQADLMLRRDGREWLLACRQGEHYRVTAPVLAEFSKSIRRNGATGGLIATPGPTGAQPDAQARPPIEVLDGATLWPMLEPLLPLSVRNSVALESGALHTRYLLLGWLTAATVGVAIAWMAVRMDVSLPSDTATSGPGAHGPRAGIAPAENPMALARAPLSEEEQREQIRHDVAELPGISRAAWSTRSTLLIYLDDDSGLDHRQSICAIVERFDELRASRLQLQPAPGSERTVRFVQCKAF